jgi:S-DNA-T family DNA segregation ATPase FtsK/SpoIIIE
VIDPTLALRGPRMVCFRGRLPAGAHLAKMRRAAAGVARELALPATPLIDNVPGEPFVAVDEPAERPRDVPLFEVLAQGPPPHLTLPFPLGCSVDGSALWLDLAELPHLLVGGATMSGGRSACRASS